MKIFVTETAPRGRGTALSALQISRHGSWMDADACAVQSGCPMMCMQSCSRVWCTALHIPSSAVTDAPAPHAAIRRSTRYPLRRTASTVQGHAIRGDANTRSSLGCGAIDVKRFLRRFCSRELVVCRERYKGLAARVPDRKLHLAKMRCPSLTDLFHLLVHSQGLHATVPIHLSGTPLAF